MDGTLRHNKLLHPEKDAIRYKNRFIIILLCFICSLLIFSLFTPSLHAYKISQAPLTDDEIDTIHSVDSSFTKNHQIANIDILSSALPKGTGWAFSWAEVVYGGGNYENLADKYLCLTLEPDAPDKTNLFLGLFKSVSGAYKIVQGLGVGMLCVWFFVHLLAKTSSDSFNLDSMIKALIKFVVGYFVISKLMNVNADGTYTGLLPTVINGVGSLVQELTGNINEVPASSNLLRIWLDLYNGSWLDAIGMVGDLLLPSLLGSVARLLIRAFSIGRIIELALLCLFAPIAVSSFFGDASHDQNYGLRYIKKIAAVCLQGAIMYFIVVFGTNLMGEFNGANVVGDVAVVCVEAALFSRSRNIACEILGVH